MIEGANLKENPYYQEKKQLSDRGSRLNSNNPNYSSNQGLNLTSRSIKSPISSGGGDLPPRGTGSRIGRAGERRRGIPRTEEERQLRHFGDGGVTYGKRNIAGLYQIYTTLGYKRGMINLYYSPNGTGNRTFRSSSPILRESVTTDNSVIPTLNVRNFRDSSGTLNPESGETITQSERSSSFSIISNNNTVESPMRSSQGPQLGKAIFRSGIDNSYYLGNNGGNGGNGGNGDFPWAEVILTIRIRMSDSSISATEVAPLGNNTGQMMNFTSASGSDGAQHTEALTDAYLGDYEPKVRELEQLIKSKAGATVVKRSTDYIDNNNGQNGNVDLQDMYEWQSLHRWKSGFSGDIVMIKGYFTSRARLTELNSIPRYSALINSFQGSDDLEWGISYPKQRITDPITIQDIERTNASLLPNNINSHSGQVHPQIL